MNLPYLDPQFKDLKKEYASVVQCNRCGFCETVCPTYVVSGKETLSPRGRNQAFRQILEGKILNPKMAEEIFSTCLTCHACTNVCFSEVPVAKLMASAKNVLAQKENLSGLRFKLLGFVLSNRKVLCLLLWISFLLKNLGVSALFKRIGLLKKISPELDAAEELLQSVPLRFGATKRKQEVKIQIPLQILPNPPLLKEGEGGLGDKTGITSISSQKKVVYFSGCGIHYLYPQAAQSCLKILRNSSNEVLCPNTACCGLIAHSTGDIQNAKKLAEKNSKELGEIDFETIVVDDDSCGGFMKSYGELLEGDLRAVAFSNKVKNLSEFLISKGVHSLLPPSGQDPSIVHSQEKTASDHRLSAMDYGRSLRVTYHDPCQMENAHQSWSAPREILRNLPGIEFVEMEEANWCCGGAGTYCLKHPELADEILQRKLFNIQNTKAEIVLTQAASCLSHIRYGLRKIKEKTEVLHLAEFLQNKITI